MKPFQLIHTARLVSPRRRARGGPEEGWSACFKMRATFSESKVSAEISWHSDFDGRI